MAEVQIGFRGTEEYRRKLQRAALDRKVKVQVLIEQAVEAFLKDPNAPPPAPAIDIPPGHEALIVRSDMAAVLRAMADWLETSGRDQVLETLQAARPSTSPPTTLESAPAASGQADSGGKKVRLKPA